MSTNAGEIIASGLGFTEGPVVCQNGAIVVTSMTEGCIARIDAGGTTVVPTGGAANGAAEGVDGSIFVAQCGSSSPLARGANVPGSIQVVRPDDTVAIVTDAPHAPNDLCFGPDGLLYVTDPTRPVGAADGRLWRCDPTSGEAELLAHVPWYPNGIAFGVEDDAIYVARTDAQQVVRFALERDGLGSPEVVVQLRDGHPDGIAFDVDGNVVVAAVRLTEGAPGDIQTWSLDGELLDVVVAGDGRMYTNVALGPDRRLVVTASDEGAVLLYRDRPLAGLPLHPFRS